MTKKKPASENKNIGSKDGDKSRREQARHTAKMEACNHARHKWHVEINRNGDKFWECKCGVFMGYK